MNFHHLKLRSLSRPILATVSAAKKVNSPLLTTCYNIVVNPFFEGEKFSFFLAPEGLNLIQSAANCEIRAKRGEARRSEVSNSCLKGPKILNFSREIMDLLLSFDT